MPAHWTRWRAACCSCARAWPRAPSSTSWTSRRNTASTSIWAWKRRRWTRKARCCARPPCPTLPWRNCARWPPRSWAITCSRRPSSPPSSTKVAAITKWRGPVRSARPPRPLRRARSRSTDSTSSTRSSPWSRVWCGVRAEPTCAPWRATSAKSSICPLRWRHSNARASAPSPLLRPSTPSTSRPSTPASSTASRWTKRWRFCPVWCWASARRASSASASCRCAPTCWSASARPRAAPFAFWTKRRPCSPSASAIPTARAIRCACAIRSGFVYCRPAIARQTRDSASTRARKMALKVARTLEELREFAPRNTAVTIGVFDGVHRGHRAILDSLAARRNAGAVESAWVITFDPHPLTVTHSREMPQILTTLDERLELFAKASVDGVFVLPFNEETMRTEYREFIQRYFLDAMNSAELVIGYDNHFGHKREGSPERVAEEGKQRGFAVTIVPPVRVDAEIVSSTTIRKTLSAANLERANYLLGHAYLVRGKVAHGQGSCLL